MLLYETRRQRASSVRSNVLASSSTARRGSPAHRAPAGASTLSTAILPGAWRGECLEPRDDLVVVRRVRPLRGDDAVGVAREEEASQRRVVALQAPAHQTVAWCIVRVSAT